MIYFILILISTIIIATIFIASNVKYILTLQTYKLPKEVMINFPKPKPNVKLRALQRAQIERDFSQQFWRHDVPILIMIILAITVSMFAFAIKIFLN